MVGSGILLERSKGVKIAVTRAGRHQGEQEESQPLAPARTGVTEASGALAKAAVTWSDGIDMVAEMAEQAVTLRDDKEVKQAPDD